MQEIKSTFKAGLVALILSFIFLLVFLLAQFLLKYKDDLFGKQLDAWELVKMCVFTVITLTPLIMPISILIMAVVYYRQKFKKDEASITETLKQSILFIIAFCFLSFLWISFVIPKATLHQNGLLYDIRMKNPDEPLHRTDLTIFKGFHTTGNLLELCQMTDTSVSKGYNLTSPAMKIIKKKIEISKMIGFPFLLFISFFIGMFIGILNRQQKYLALPLIGIFFVIFPALNYLMIWFEKLAKEEKVSPAQGQLYFILILTAITLVLYKYSTTQLRFERGAADNK